MPRYIDAEKIEYDDLPLGILELHNVAFKDDVDKIPTADVQEVKHGKWEEREGILVCSECGHATEDTVDVQTETGGWQLRYPYYCGKCGARMDK